MENIGNLHLALAPETSEDPEIVKPKFPSRSHRHKLSGAMAMLFLPLTLSLIVVSFAGSALASIKEGSRGPEVSNIQRCLKRLGYFNGPVNGNFGSQTKQAVINFQRAKGIQAIGTVGPQTQQRLNASCSPSRPAGGGTTNSSGVLKPGSNGPAVTRLQQNLKSLGYYNGPISGNFGQETLRAVIRFQQDYGIPADGVVGTTTRQTITASLNGGDRPRPPYTPPESPPIYTPVSGELQLGSEGFLVQELQQNLQRLRYFNDRINGYYGPGTRDAVINFQRDYGLRISGIADQRTLNAINTALQSTGGPGQDADCGSGTGDVCFGENSQRVAAVQQRLRELGWFNGNPTGYFGQTTRDAVAQFQRYYRLNPTGNVDYETWQALGLNRTTVDPNPRGDYRYVVVVPISNYQTLDIVRQYYPEAYSAESGLGRYVNAGSFPTREDAEKRSRFLRGRGLDARVEYM